MGRRGTFSLLKIQRHIAWLVEGYNSEDEDENYFLGTDQLWVISSAAGADEFFQLEGQGGQNELLLQLLVGLELRKMTKEKILMRI